MARYKSTSPTLAAQAGLGEAALTYFEHGWLRSASVTQRLVPAHAADAPQAHAANGEPHGGAAPARLARARLLLGRRTQLGETEASLLLAALAHLCNS